MRKKVYDTERYREVHGLARARREAILEYRRDDPYATLAEIAQLVGVTRERVRQVLLKHLLPTTAVTVAKAVRRCKVCYKPITRNGSKHYCSMACLTKDHQVSLVCSVCGKPFKIRVCEH